MTANRYRVTWNGLQVITQTWDDVLNRDGQADEVFFRCEKKKAKSDGTIVYGGSTSSPFVSMTMGDTSSPATLGPRIQAGSGTQWGGRVVGGLMSGDVFPIPPWTAPSASQLTNNYPPCLIWEDDIDQNEVVSLIPTIWEWDGGAGFMNGWLQWQVDTDTKFGSRAKDVFGTAAGPYKWIFDAVSLGIQTAGTLQGLFSPLGQPGDRPIGIQRDPSNPKNGLFSPQIIELTKASAEALLAANLNGKGNGIFSVEYRDDSYLRGDYLLWFQITRIGDNHPDAVSTSHQTDFVPRTVEERLTAYAGNTIPLRQLPRPIVPPR
jgi:hypothetical protein